MILNINKKKHKIVDAIEFWKLGTISKIKYLKHIGILINEENTNNFELNSNLMSVYSDFLKLPFNDTTPLLFKEWKDKTYKSNVKDSFYYRNNQIILFLFNKKTIDIETYDTRDSLFRNNYPKTIYEFIMICNILKIDLSFRKNYFNKIYSGINLYEVF